MRSHAAIIASFLFPALVCVLGVGETGKGLAGTWRFSNGSEFPGATGKMETLTDGVQKTSFDFTKGGNYVGAYLDLNPLLTVKTVTFRVNKPEEGVLTLRVTDSSGQDFQKQVDIEGKGWQEVSTLLDGWTAYWGGAADGIFQMPVRSVGFLIESAGLDSPKGMMLIDAVTGTEGDSVATGKSPSFDGRYMVTDLSEGAGLYASPPGCSQGRVLQISDSNKSSGAQMIGSLSLFGRPKVLDLRVKCGTPGAVLKISLGSHFQTFEKTLGVLEGGPQTFSTTMPPDGWVHSGAKETEISYPLRITAVTLEPGNSANTNAEVEFNALECTTKLPRNDAITLFSMLEGDMSGTGGDVSLTARCRAWNMSEDPIRGKLTMILRDWESRILNNYSMEWMLPELGKPVEMTRPVVVPARLNFADVEFRFESEGNKPATARSGFTRNMYEAGSPSLQPESPWGMGVYLYRYPFNEEGLKNMDRAAAKAQAAGVKWSREEFSWAGIEIAPGQYDFSFYDAVVNTARKHGISVYGLLSYWGRFTQPYTEKGIDDFCIWARATVHQFKDRVKYWEVYNEPNIFFWEGPKELYPVLVERCFRAIKEEDPTATVLAVSSAGIDKQFIKKVVDAQAPFDVLTIHPYRNKLNDAGYVRELQEAAALVSGRPVWITEMGWSTHLKGGVDERAQAQLLSRCYMGAIASGAVQNMGWYDFRDDGTDPFYFESNFGVLRADMTPKPAYRALATVCITFREGKPTRPEIQGEGVFGLQMGRSLALWSQKGAKVSLKFSKPPERVSNLMGESLQIDMKSHRLELSLQPGSPVFLTGVEHRKIRVEK